jgi:Protein of unknown function (DUF4242)
MLFNAHVVANGWTISHGYQRLNRSETMPRFIIERNIPGANTLSAQELSEIASKSNAVVNELGEPYTWITSYVAGDKIYCVHEAETAEVIRRHAREGGFPADSVSEIAAIIDPMTAKSSAS